MEIPTAVKTPATVEAAAAMETSTTVEAAATESSGQYIPTAYS
jgi:hypothetical protein